MDKHIFEFTDLDCLTISDALSYLIKDEERHPIDRKEASQIKDKIFETVKKDKIKYYQKGLKKEKKQ